MSASGSVARCGIESTRSRRRLTDSAAANLRLPFSHLRLPLLRLHGRRRRWQVDLADRPIYFADTARRLQTVGQKESLQRDGICPEVLQGSDVICLELKQSPLCDQDLRVGGCHPAIALQIQLVHVSRTWNHPLPVPFYCGAGGDVVL